MIRFQVSCKQHNARNHSNSKWHLRSFSTLFKCFFITFLIQVSKVAEGEDCHKDDIECCVVMKDVLYTGSDEGTIKAWSLDLDLVTSWPAHDYVVYDLAMDPANNVLYSCSMDGQIKRWSVAVSSEPQLLNTTIQTGPTGEAADLGGLGGTASLEHEPATVRKIVFRDGTVWAGDEMGSVCQWSADLSTCHLKKEYYTEIWSLVVSRDNRTVLTARDNEVISADVSKMCCNNLNTVLVNYTLPGRAPVVMNKEEEVMVCPTRGGMDIMVRRRRGTDKFQDTQILQRHDMIVNTILMEDNMILSAGWDARVVFWVTIIDDGKLISNNIDLWQSQEHNHYEYVEDVKLESYVNTMCSAGPGRRMYFVGGKKGYLARISK